MKNVNQLDSTVGAFSINHSHVVYERKRLHMQTAGRAALNTMVKQKVFQLKNGNPVFLSSAKLTGRLSEAVIDDFC